MPRAHPLAARRRVSLAQLSGEAMVLPPEGRPHRALLDEALRAKRVTVSIGAVAQGWELTLKLVELGFGLAVVNGCCRIPRGLVARPLAELPSVNYVAFTRSDARPAAKALASTLANHGDDWRER